jgi:hypothetical protein
MSAIENTAKIETLGGIVRWITPILMGVVIFYLNNMNTTLNIIEDKVGQNRISVIKLEANQSAYWDAFNTYRQLDELRLRDIKTEVNEINTEVDTAFEEMHKLDIHMREYWNQNENK